jgi:hypothetical protein
MCGELAFLIFGLSLFTGGFLCGYWEGIKEKNNDE